jgi:hypothetical protein
VFHGSEVTSVSFVLHFLCSKGTLVIVSGTVAAKEPFLRRCRQVCEQLEGVINIF